ncbi:hypothetical protein L9F63_028211, partial [Diploptera punctata]
MVVTREFLLIKSICLKRSTIDHIFVKRHMTLYLCHIHRPNKSSFTYFSSTYEPHLPSITLTLSRRRLLYR